MNEFVVNTDLFGRYANIPTDYSGNKHIYKVITLYESNCYCDVPLTVNSEPALHKEIVPVLNVIHCGVDESEVIRVALKDCEILKAKIFKEIAAERKRIRKMTDNCVKAGSIHAIVNIKKLIKLLDALDKAEEYLDRQIEGGKD